MSSRLGVALLAAVFLAALVLTPAGLAHAELERSDPLDGTTAEAAPTEAHLWFDEPISPKFSTAEVLDAAGKPVPPRFVRAAPGERNHLVVGLPGELGDGIYSVTWKVLSETDGHFTRGTTVFGVGDVVAPAPAPKRVEEPIPPAEVALRWSSFTLLAGLVGAIAIAFAVLGPLAPAPQGGSSPGAAAHRARRRVLAGAGICAVLSLGIAVGWLAWQARTLAAASSEGFGLDFVVQLLGSSRWGALWLARVALLLLVLIGVGVMIRRLRTGGRVPRLAIVLAAAGACAVAAVHSLGGHSASVDRGALSVAADTVHIVAAGVWIGGGLTLAIAVLLELGRSRAEAVTLVKTTWRSFGRLAAASVGILVVTGLYATAAQVASVDALVGTVYGKALLGKLLLVAVVGAFGFVNATLTTPRLAAPVAFALRRPRGWRPVPPRLLPRVLLAEASMGVLVFLAVAVMTSAKPARGAEFEPVHPPPPSSASSTVGDVLVTLDVKPNLPGRNVFELLAVSTLRPEPAPIERVLLRVASADGRLAASSWTLKPIGQDRFRLAGSQLPVAGEWKLDAVVRRRGLEDRVVPFDWRVAEPTRAVPVRISNRPLAPILNAAAAAAAGFLCLLIALAAFRPALREVWRQQPRPPTAPKQANTP